MWHCFFHRNIFFFSHSHRNSYSTFDIVWFIICVHCFDASNLCMKIHRSWVFFWGLSLYPEWIFTILSFHREFFVFWHRSRCCVDENYDEKICMLNWPRYTYVPQYMLIISSFKCLFELLIIMSSSLLAIIFSVIINNNRPIHEFHSLFEWNNRVRR